ncbi:MAG TPA: C4-dicarboxylate TRAP transporter substrate-binding protein [Limnobacter sp.]|uniref:C4-dicarboxylate TRAP transporter substrate-binding protein n=1 Tax=Limnobacter sp. TaxID=2003368 RepID=UPI002E3105ED|nr:C4-dicarboxylate TRAP transporter substrate-binding protein [Limnobacter sp.]HEX5487230.1 C4-dicarboxylate TRAP transporter substrate-binding protein [Limnobacter sp.]
MFKPTTILRTALAASVLLAGIAKAQATEIKVSLYWGPKSPIVLGGYKPFIKSIEEDKAADLQMKLFSGGALLDAKGTLPGLRSGIADVGTLALTYFPAELPHSQLVADMALIGKSSVAAAAAVTDYVLKDCAPCREDWKKLGLVYTGAYSTTPYLLISKTKITSLADLKGKKIRSPGAVWDRWIQSVGAVPVNVPSSEMYESFDRGIVDVVIHASSAMKTVNLGDIGKYVVKLPLGTYHALSAGSYNINTWKKLTTAQRKAILDRTPILVVGISDQYHVQDVEAEKLYAGRGVTITEPSADMLKQINDFRKADMANIIEAAKTKYGFANPQPEIDKIEALFDKWNKLLAPANGDRAKMEAIVKKEIYDTLDPATFGM